MTGLKRLLQEVHQRSLWQLLASYVVGAWLVLQIAETLASLIGLPLWFGAGVIALLAFGLVLVLTTGLVQVVAAYRSDPDRSYREVRRLFSWKHALIAGLVAAAALVLGTGGYMGLRAMGIGPMGSLVAKGVIEPGKRIVLADFQNLTTDSTDAIVVTEALRTDLSQSRLLRLAEPEYLRRVLARMEKDPDEVLDEELAREVAIREGLGAVIAGEVSAVGTSYVLSVRLVTPETGEAIDGWRETARGSDQIIDAIDRLSKGIRQRAGESLRSIRRSEPLPQVTTSSLEALRKFSLGQRRFRTSGSREALPLLEEAVGLDSSFAAAWRALSAAYNNQGRGSAAREAISTAYASRDRVTEPERYDITGMYHLLVTGDVDATLQAYGALVELSDSTLGLNNLALAYARLREFQQAEQLHRRNIENDSVNVLAWNNLLNALIRQGKLSEAQRTLDEHGDKLSPGVMHQALAELAAYRGDFSAAETHIRTYSDLGSGRDDRLSLQARASYCLGNLALLQGKLAEARDHFSAAVATEEMRGSSAQPFRYARALALLDARFNAGTDRGLSALEAMIAAHPDDAPRLPLARFFAVVDMPVRARQLLDEYEANADQSVPPLARNGWYQRTAGIVALAEGRLEDGIAHLHLGDDWGCLYCSSRFLALAFDGAGMSDSAVAYYERSISTYEQYRRIGDALADGFFLPDAYERLGMLYEERGDREKAIYYYGLLAELWKTADPELQPRVNAARRAIEALSTDR